MNRRALRFSLMLSLMVLVFALGLGACTQRYPASPTPPSYAGHWPGKPYATVRGYAYDFMQAPGRPFIVGGVMHPGVIDPQGKLLSAEQSRRLLAAVTSDRGTGFRALCYYPHHAFVFFNAAGRPVGSLDVCFTCGTYEHWPKGLANRWDLASIRGIVRELRLPLLPDSAAYTQLFEQSGRTVRASRP
jgi:hypothetical protein